MIVDHSHQGRRRTVGFRPGLHSRMDACSHGYSGPWKKINACVKPAFSAYVRRASRKVQLGLGQKLRTTCTANIARNIQANKDGVSIIEAVDQIVRRRIESYFIGHIGRPRFYIRGGFKIAFPQAALPSTWSSCIASDQKSFIKQIGGFQIG